jgi:anti-anti-sigma factor
MDNQNIQIVASKGAHQGERILQLKGPLCIHTIFDFQTAVKAEASPTLIVDFSNVPFVDSAGLGILVGAQLSARRENRKLVLAGMNTQVKALFDMTKVNEFFSIYPTIQDAEAASTPD